MNEKLELTTGFLASVIIESQEKDIVNPALEILDLLMETKKPTTVSQMVYNLRVRKDYKEFSRNEILVGLGLLCVANLVEEANPNSSKNWYALTDLAYLAMDELDELDELDKPDEKKEVCSDD